MGVIGDFLDTMSPDPLVRNKGLASLRSGMLLSFTEFVQEFLFSTLVYLWFSRFCHIVVRVSFLRRLVVLSSSDELLRDVLCPLIVHFSAICRSPYESLSVWGYIGIESIIYSLLLMCPIEYSLSVDLCN